MKEKLALIASDAKKEEFKIELADLESEYEFAEDAENILLLGGDGSLNHLVNNFSLSELSKRKIIYFPTGSANDFARSLKIIPNAPTTAKIKSVLNQNKMITIPICKCNDRYFINVMCAGAAALVTESGDTLLKKVMGKVTYYLGAIEQILMTSIYKYKFKSDTITREVESPGFVVSQGLYAGGGVKVSPSYCANFGERFDFVSLSNEKLSSIISSTLELQKEEPNLDDLEIDFISTKKITVKSAKDIPAKLDGEEYSAKSFVIEKSSNTLQFYLH